jgi:hypothetical protein
VGKAYAVTANGETSTQPGNNRNNKSDVTVAKSCKMNVKHETAKLGETVRNTMTYGGANTVKNGDEVNTVKNGDEANSVKNGDEVKAVKNGEANSVKNGGANTVKNDGEVRANVPDITRSHNGETNGHGIVEVHNGEVLQRNGNGGERLGDSVGDKKKDGERDVRNKDNVNSSVDKKASNKENVAHAMNGSNDITAEGKRSGVDIKSGVTVKSRGGGESGGTVIMRSGVKSPVVMDTSTPKSAKNSPTARPTKLAIESSGKF